MHTPDPVVISLEQYYAWSAEAMDGMRAEIAELLTVFRELHGELLPNNIEPAHIDDIAGLLGFLSLVPDGEVIYQESVAVLAIRHDCNNLLMQVFGRVDFLGDHPLHGRFDALYRKYHALRKARHRVVERPSNP